MVVYIYSYLLLCTIFIYEIVCQVFLSALKELVIVTKTQTAKDLW